MRFARHVPHVDRSLVGHVEGIPYADSICVLQGVDPWVAPTRGRNMLGGDVVAKVPVPGVRVAISALWWQAFIKKKLNKEACKLITMYVYTILLMLYSNPGYKQVTNWLIYSFSMQNV